MFVYPLCYSLNPLSAYLRPGGNDIFSSPYLLYSISFPLFLLYYYKPSITCSLQVSILSLSLLSPISSLFPSLTLPPALLQGSRREWGPLYSSLFSPPFPLLYCRGPEGNGVLSSPYRFYK
jgi:hypothetical protein